jgi:diguanylate cyclase (GGDEF)-like protein
MVRESWVFGLIYVDVDSFKAINDGLGHEAGDRVLRSISRTMAGCVRTYDTVARWGGDELIAIIAHVSRSQLDRIAAKIRALVGSTTLRHSGQTVRLAVSVGATLARPRRSSDGPMRRCTGARPRAATASLCSRRRRPSRLARCALCPARGESLRDESGVDQRWQTRLALAHI